MPLECNQQFVYSQELRRGQIIAGDTDIWNGELLRIPPVPPTGLGGCSIIAVSYRYNVEQSSKSGG